MRYVALPRGINVTGSNMIKMTDLKAAFESLGLKNVVTYINSGNLAFDTNKTSETTLVKKIAPVLEKLAGRPISVMVREQSLIKEILAANPFKGEYASHKEMHVLFLERETTDDQLVELKAAAPKEERFVAKGREIYLHIPMGVAESLLGRGLVEKKLKVAVTARNWRTVEKLAEL
jgi:uncharacterized protein (DUF1697 family)